MTTRSRHIGFLFVAVLALSLWAAAAASQTLYGITHAPGASALRTIDPGTGSSAPVIGLGLDAVATSAVAVSVAGNAVYVAGRLAGANVLAVVDPSGPTLVTRPLDRGFANLFARADGQLVGFSPNGATWEVRSLDPATGNSSLLAAVPSLGTLVPAAAALDPGVALYQIGRSTADASTPRLFILDPGTGALGAAVALTRDYHSLHVRSDGALMGLGWSGSAEELHLIDTGAGTSVAYQTFPAFGVLPPGASTNDRSAGRVYQVGHAASPADPPRLYGEDAAVGGPYAADLPLGEGYAALVHSGGSAVAVGGGRVSYPVALSAARPNPFQGTTLIPFSLDRSRRVEIEIVDVTGRILRTLLLGTLDAGAHAVMWGGDDERGRGVAAGVYLVRMRTGERTLTRRIVLLP